MVTRAPCARGIVAPSDLTAEEREIVEQVIADLTYPAVRTRIRSMTEGLLKKYEGSVVTPLLLELIKDQVSLFIRTSGAGADVNVGSKHGEVIVELRNFRIPMASPNEAQEP